MLPLSALLELAGFILFFVTVGRYRGAPAASGARANHGLMGLVIAGSVGFLLILTANAVVAAKQRLSASALQSRTWQTSGCLHSLPGRFRS